MSAPDLQALDWTEDAAEMLLAHVRWPDTNGTPVCPDCGDIGPYPDRTRKRFKCKSCERVYSRYAGTVFHSHKLPASKIVKAMILFEKHNYKISSRELMRQLNVNYRTAYVMNIRLFEAYTADDGLLSVPSLLSRGYWQGGLFSLNLSGQIVRQSRDGRVCVA